MSPLHSTYANTFIQEEAIIQESEKMKINYVYYHENTYF